MSVAMVIVCGYLGDQGSMLMTTMITTMAVILPRVDEAGDHADSTTCGRGW